MKDEISRQPTRRSTRKARAEDREANVDTGLIDGLVGYRLRLATNAMMSDLMTSLEPTALRPVLFAILAVVRNNPGIIQTVLGNALGIQRANLVPLLNELGDRDLLERRVAPHDKRAYALHLTPAGSRLLDETLIRIAEHEARFFGVLTERERAALTSSLIKLARPTR